MPSKKSLTHRKTLADTLQLLLDAGIGERAGLAPFVKKFPQVVQAALMPHEHAGVRGITEFQFGNELRADFVLLQGFSGGFIVKVIEWEPSTARMLNAKGSFSGRFNHAYSQILSWKEDIRNPARGMSMNLDLERQFREREILAPWLRGRNPIDNTAQYPLGRAECTLWMQYAIVIGRRHDLTEAANARKRTLMDEQIEVVSWDRLLDSAYRFLPDGEVAPARNVRLGKKDKIMTAEEWNLTLAKLRSSRISS